MAASAREDDIKVDVDHQETALAIEQLIDDDKTFVQSLKENSRVALFTFLANCGALLFGYDVLVQGAINALPMFSVYFGSPYGEGFILPALWQGLWQALSAFGIMVGAAGNGFLQDKLGRKVMFFVGGFVSAVGTAVTYVASEPSGVEERRSVLLLGKFIIGVSMGILMSTCQTYVSEISPPKLRTVLLGFYAFCITVGQMIAITVVFSRLSITDASSFKVPFASQWAFSGYAMLVAFLVPESPVYLINCEKLDQARKSLNILTPSLSADERIAFIQATAKQESSSNDGNATKFSECFQGTDLRRTRIVALLNLLQQFMGITLISNSTYFFIMAGMSSSMSLTLNQVGVGCSMVCTLISWVILAKVGRRMAILASFVAAGVIFLGMGVAGCWPQNPQALRFIGVALLIIGCCGNLGTGTAYPIAAAEVPSTRLRAKTLGVGFGVNAFGTWAFSLCVPYMFNADQGNLGGKIGFVFAGFCLVGFILSYLDVPETKDITYPRINQLFKARIPARKFKRMASQEGEQLAV